MQEATATWREHPLVVGQSYVALQSFNGSPGSNFEARLVYVLTHIDYSRYDSMTIFTSKAGNGSQEQWWWHDEQPDAQVSERFRVAP